MLTGQTCGKVGLSSAYMQQARLLGGHPSLRYTTQQLKLTSQWPRQRHCKVPGRQPAGCAAKGFGRPEPRSAQLPDQPKRPPANASLPTRLQHISVAVVGDSTELNAEVAKRLAKALDYVPLLTGAVLSEATGQTVEEFIDSEGLAALGIAEAAVLHSLSTHIRSSIGTIGGGGGAAARGNCWRYLFGHICIWLDISWESEPKAAQNEAYAQSEIALKVTRKNEGLQCQPTAELAGILTEQAIAALDRLTKKDPNLCGRKGVYVKFGCRGDWPNIEVPPGAQQQADAMMAASKGR